MYTEKDVRRDVKKTGFVLGVVLFCAITGGFLLSSWLTTPPLPSSRINVDKAAGGSGKSAPESAQYQEILRQNNAEGARQAQAANTSFIASMSAGILRQVPPITQDPARSPAQKAVPAIHYKPPPPTTSSKVAPEQKKALEALLRELIAQRSAPSGQVASATGFSSGQTGGLQTSPYASWTQSLLPAVDQTELPRVAGRTPDRVIIPAGSRPGAIIDTAIDSDNASSQVLAHIPAGPYAGAILIAKGVQLAGDGVSIHFTKMTWNQDTWRVDAWAATPDTLQSSVASSVNNRYGTRILLPALAHGLGLGGQLYASANTQILSNGNTTIEGRVGMPDGTAVAGTVLGGAAQRAGQVIANDAQKLPVKQVIVNRGQSIALIFMTAVKESDKETHTATESAPANLP